MSSILTWEPIAITHTEVIHAAIHGNVAEYFYPFKNINETKKWVMSAMEKHKEGKKEEYVLFDEGQFIGIVSPYFISKDEVEVGIWIAPSQQRKGYGKKVLIELFERLRARGVTKVLYQTEAGNEASIKLATALGFTKVESKENILFVKYLDC